MKAKIIDISDKVNNPVLNGMMSEERKEELLSKIKENYHLFGVEDSIYGVKFDIKVDIKKEGRENSTLVIDGDTIKYYKWDRGTGDNAVESIEGVESEEDITDNIWYDEYNRNYLSFHSLAYGTNELDEITGEVMIHLENKPVYGSDNIQLLLVLETSNNITEHASDAEWTEYYLNSKDDITLVSEYSEEDSEEFGEHIYSCIIWFVKAKGLPLVRIYDKDKFKIENIEDKKSFINTYFSEFDIRSVDCIQRMSQKDIKSMKYKDKAKDIFKYIKDEEFTVVTDEPGDIHFEYKNSLGIESTIKYFDNPAKAGTYREVRYKGNVIYYMSESNSKSVNIKEAEFGFNKTFKSVEGALEEYNYINTDCDKVTDEDEKKKLINTIKNNKASKEIISYHIESIDIDKFEFYKAKDGSRYVLISNDLTIYIINDICVYVVLESDKFSFYGLTDLEDSKVVFTSLLSINKVNENVTETVINFKNDNKYEFFLANAIVNGLAVATKFSAPELTVDTSFNDKGERVINKLDSLIYSRSDKFVNIRDTFGVPNRLYLKEKLNLK